MCTVSLHHPFPTGTALSVSSTARHPSSSCCGACPTSSSFSSSASLSAALSGGTRSMIWWISQSGESGCSCPLLCHSCSATQVASSHLGGIILVSGTLLAWIRHGRHPLLTPLPAQFGQKRLVCALALQHSGNSFLYGFSPVICQTQQGCCCCRRLFWVAFLSFEERRKSRLSWKKSAKRGEMGRLKDEGIASLVFICFIRCIDINQYISIGFPLG